MLKPMLASLTEASLDDPEFAYEPKYDGIRAIIDVPAGGRGVRLWSRLGNEKTSQFPEIASALERWARRLKAPVVLDGEVVALDATGDPAGFQDLQQRGRESVSRSASDRATAFIAFDLLREGHADLRARSFLERRAIVRVSIDKVLLPARDHSLLDGIERLLEMRDHLLAGRSFAFSPAGVEPSSESERHNQQHQDRRNRRDGFRRRSNRKQRQQPQHNQQLRSDVHPGSENIFDNRIDAVSYRMHQRRRGPTKVEGVRRLKVACQQRHRDARRRPLNDPLLHKLHRHEEQAAERVERRKQNRESNHGAVSGRRRKPCSQP